MHEDTRNPTVRETATVTVDEPVDGTARVKGRSKGLAPTRRVINDTLSLDDCDPRVAAAARRIRKPGQIIRVVSPTDVWVVNR